MVHVGLTVLIMPGTIALGTLAQVLKLRRSETNTAIPAYIKSLMANACETFE